MWPMVIKTERFYLRELNSHDATARYLSWFKDVNISNNIQYSMNDLFALKHYILEKRALENCVLFGIFTQEGDEHIGNIKYEPIKNHFTIMGILIGEKFWRGKGVAAEVIIASSRYLQIEKQVNSIYLGVKQSNIAAINAYHKIGFVDDDSSFLPVDKKLELLMVWHLTSSK